MITLAALRRRLEKAWGPDTSYMRDAWNPALPSEHQCYVTALVVRAYFGGAILKGTVEGEVAFWNRLPSGREVDLTADQYGGTPPTPWLRTAGRLSTAARRIRDSSGSSRG